MKGTVTNLPKSAWAGRGPRHKGPAKERAMLSRKTRGDVIRLAVLWVAISFVAEAGTAYLIRQYPTMTSSQGLVTAEAIAFLLWITVPVFVLVVLQIGRAHV